jgi:hypothetical protein
MGGGWSPYWAHSALRPLLAYCTWPRSWWNERFWQGKPNYSEKTFPSATSPTTNPVWTDSGSNPGHHSGKPATNRLCSTYICKQIFWLPSLDKLVAPPHPHTRKPVKKFCITRARCSTMNSDTCYSTIGAFQWVHPLLKSYRSPCSILFIFFLTCSWTLQ